MPSKFSTTRLRRTRPLPLQRGLGEAYWRKYQLTHDKEWADAAIENCQKGLHAMPCLRSAHLSRPRFCGHGATRRRLRNTAGDRVGADERRRACRSRLCVRAAQRLDEAEKTFKQAIAMRPNYWATYNCLVFFTCAMRVTKTL